MIDREEFDAAVDQQLEKVEEKIREMREEGGYTMDNLGDLIGMFARVCDYQNILQAVSMLDLKNRIHNFNDMMDVQ